MLRRFLPPILLLALLGIVCAQLWYGPGNLQEVAQLRQKIQAQKLQNSQVHRANEQLASEVNDLRTGQESVQERARMELGMIKPNEIFIHVTPHQ